MCVCAGVCVYLTVCKCIFTRMDESASLPHPTAQCPPGDIAASTVVIRGRAVQQQVFYLPFMSPYVNLRRL